MSYYVWFSFSWFFSISFPFNNFFILLFHFQSLPPVFLKLFPFRMFILLPVSCLVVCTSLSFYLYIVSFLFFSSFHSCLSSISFLLCLKPFLSFHYLYFLSLLFIKDLHFLCLFFLSNLHFILYILFCSFFPPSLSHPSPSLTIKTGNRKMKEK